MVVTLVGLLSLCCLCCKGTIPVLSCNPLNGIYTYLEYILTRTASVIWSMPKPWILKQLPQRWKQSLLLMNRRGFLPLGFIKCWVYYDSPITHIDKEQQGQRQDQRKNCHYLWPRFQSCAARCWICVRYWITYFKHSHLPFWDTNLSQTVFFELLRTSQCWTPSRFFGDYW